VTGIDSTTPVFSGTNSALIIENVEHVGRNIPLVSVSDSRLVVRNVLARRARVFGGGYISAGFNSTPSGSQPAAMFSSLAQQIFQAAGTIPPTLQGKLDRLEEVSENAEVVIDRTFVVMDSGAALRINGDATSIVRNSFFDNPSAGPTVNLGGDNAFAKIENSVVAKSGIDPALRIDVGDMSLSNVTIDAEDALDVTNDNLNTTITHSILGSTTAANQMDTTNSVCKLGTGVTLTSGGFNIVADDSCGLAGTGDQTSVDPMIAPPVGDGLVPTLDPDSPAIDAGANFLLGGGGGKGAQAVLPCGFKDMTGLARPQDFSANSDFNCDIGAIEVQGGPDIGSPQSAAFFDPARNGEGIFVEMLGGGLAFVAEFTYTADGSGPAWFVGIGDVIGNSVVVDDMLVTSGGIFGDAFDPTAVSRARVGGLSLNFPTCLAGGAPGKQSFQAALGSPFQDLLASAMRLSTIVGCSGPPASVSGRSGSFFDPARDGEGIFVQWLDTGQVVVIWYTYDPEGNQFWTISGETTINGNSVTASMLYPAGSTSFGSGFNPAEVDIQPWGTLTLTYSGCNQVRLDYESTVSGFGSGGLDYVRLTSLSGTSCDL
jgi:hypothetical protein